VHGFLRLHSVKPGQGVLDSVWREKEPLLLRGEDSRLEDARQAPFTTSSAMIAPLIYGEDNLGILVVARSGETEPFLTNEFQIFKAIADQSAFALTTASIFSEAAEKKRLDQDLQVAHEIQRILLPASAPLQLHPGERPVPPPPGGHTAAASPRRAPHPSSSRRVRRCSSSPSERPALSPPDGRATAVSPPARALPRLLPMRYNSSPGEQPQLIPVSMLPIVTEMGK
jgi:hypothetical protein